MEASRSEVWLLQYVGTSIQVSMVLSSLERNKHRKREVKLLDAASFSGCQGKPGLLLNWKHYKWRKYHTDLYSQESLSYQGWYVLKNLPIDSLASVCWPFLLTLLPSFIFFWVTLSLLFF